MEGYPKVWKLYTFPNVALLSCLEKYERMQSSSMSTCNLTVNDCKLLANNMPWLNVEAMKDEGSDNDADKLYIYR